MSIVKRCKHCNSEFIPNNNRRIFCSDECYELDKQANAKLKRQSEHKIRKDNGKACKTCNKRFVPTGNNSQFCYECRPMYQKRTKTAIEMMDCKSCGEPIIKTAHNKRFCDKCKIEKEKKRVAHGIKKLALKNAKVKETNEKHGAKPIDPKWLRRY